MFYKLCIIEFQDDQLMEFFEYLLKAWLVVRVGGVWRKRFHEMLPWPDYTIEKERKLSGRLIYYSYAYQIHFSPNLQLELRKQNHKKYSSCREIIRNDIWLNIINAINSDPYFCIMFFSCDVSLAPSLFSWLSTSSCYTISFPDWRMI